MNQASENQTTIQFNVANTPAILERLLRTIRVRGFSLEDMTMRSNNQQLEIELCVSGERSITMLVNQLNKLVDVNMVSSFGNSASERMSA